MIKAHTFEFPPDRCLLGIRVTPRAGFVAPETSRIEAIIGGRNVPCPYTVVDKELGPIPPTAEAHFPAGGVFAERVVVKADEAFDVEPMWARKDAPPSRCGWCDSVDCSGLTAECRIGRAIGRVVAQTPLTPTQETALTLGLPIVGQKIDMTLAVPPRGSSTAFARIRAVAEQASPVFRVRTRHFIDMHVANVDGPMTDRIKAEILLAAARERAIAEPSHDETFLAPSWQDTNERRLLDAEEMAALLLAAFAAVGLEARPVGLIPPGREHPASVVVEVKIDGAWALADGMRDLPLGAPEIVPEGYDVCRPRIP